MGGLLTLTSFLLLMALDYMPDIPSRSTPPPGLDWLAWLANC